MANNSEENLLEEEQIETSEPVEEGQESNQTETVDNSQKEDKREIVRKKDYKEMWEKSQKSFDNHRSMTDRQLNELRKELQSLKPLRELYTKSAEEQQQVKLAQLAQTDPAAYQKALIEQAKQQLQQQYAPLQEQAQAQQAFVEATNYTNYMQQTYGAEVYQAAEPVMQIMLDGLLQQPADANGITGQEYAKILAKNPDFLMRAAVGDMYLNQYKGLQQNQQKGQQVQQKAVQFAKGSARPASSASRNVNSSSLSDDKLREAAYKELASKFGQS